MKWTFRNTNIKTAPYPGFPTDLQAQIMVLLCKANKKSLIKEDYNGIRPAHGYPSIPDHSEKIKIWDLLEVEKNIDVSLTENFALNPASSICGLYFFNPQSRYFNLGKISNAQFELYAAKKGYNIDRMRSLLQNNLID